MSTGSSAVPDGVDLDAVAAWLSTRVAVHGDLDVTTITGGRSNLTYRVTDRDGCRWVLRRPPLNSVLRSAHDVGREHRVMAALAGSPVPVPPLVGHEPEPGVLDAPFYVMDFVDGHVVRDPADADVLDDRARRRAGHELVDVLVALHDVDPDRVGLGDLGPRADYLARQLRRWRGQYDRGASREVPAIPALHERLVAAVPTQQADRIVHGDYRLDNVLLDDDGSIAAVLDWELCTLGDPLADLGLLVVYWDPFGSGEGLPMIPAAAAVPGMPDVDEVVARYATRSDLDLSDLPTYVVFGCWKLAVILEGVLARSKAGAYGPPDQDTITHFEHLVEALLDAAAMRADQAGI
ncbi:phosphotransferase family protein [Salsipaludibacter albus]|uniref:phosphotransferase family protein n=1 Tax=Salsipaludibacter albus TaxID=2849650 RepID=UPI001EE4A0CD|nr:phosphotransferase family protein [Salsipaludibacter albus]